MPITWRNALGAALVIVLAAACQSMQAGSPASASAPEARSMQVELKNPAGQQVATAQIVEGLAPALASGSRLATATRMSPSPGVGVTVAIEATDLPPGTHGFHVHAVGACDAPDFASAGGHLNPRHGSHGVNNPKGPHGGDLPNLTVDSERTALAAFFVGHLGLADINSSPSGASLIIDAGPDDDATDPDGGSGAHLACGVIVAGRPAAAAPTPPPPAPTTMTVAFSGLPQGTFPVHLHTICNGSQSFHITVLDNLVVGGQGTGSISVPAQDFGQGWCVIVYGNSSLSTVLATRGV